MDERANPAAPKPLGTLAVSECLRGSAVRWDGDHNGEGWPRRVVEQLFDLIGICPEVGIGLGVPRPPIRLFAAPGDAEPRAVVMTETPADITPRLTEYAATVASTVAQVDGYIFADRSPSCGLAGVKVFAQDGSYRRIGRGIFAAAVRRSQPTLPAVDAECLQDPATLLDFACAVAAHRAGDENADQAPHRRARIARLLAAAAKRAA